MASATPMQGSYANYNGPTDELNIDLSSARISLSRVLIRCDVRGTGL